MTKQEAAKLVAVMVAATAQGARLDGEAVTAMVDAYASLLSDLDYARCSAAVRALLQGQTWIPSVAEIRKVVLELERGPKRSGGEAWGAVVQAMKHEGAYKFPGIDFKFVDPVTARCVEHLGWKELCLSENQVSDRARFIELYDNLADRAEREDRSPVLAAAQRNRDQHALRDSLGRVVGHLRLVPPSVPQLDRPSEEGTDE